jgi:hypothetical protein
VTGKNIDSKALLNQKNYILKAKRITAFEFDKMKENIRFKIVDDTEDHTNKVNGVKMDTNFIAHQKRAQEKTTLALVNYKITKTEALKLSST